MQKIELYKSYMIGNSPSWIITTVSKEDIVDQITSFEYVTPEELGIEMEKITNEQMEKIAEEMSDILQLGYWEALQEALEKVMEGK